MTKIISICQNKGGVGKTTTALNLGYLFSDIGNTLLIDLDSQANLSQTFDIFLSDTDLSLKDFIDNSSGYDLGLDYIRDIKSNLSIIPNNPGFEKWKKNINSKKNISYLLREALSSIKSSYDYILIDCPPSLDVSFDLALYSSDYALIMMDGHPYSMQGLDNILSEIQQVKKYDITKSIDLKVLGIVFTRYKNNIIVNDIIDSAKNNYKVFDTKIRENIAIPESQALKKSIFDYDIKSNGSTDYKNLFNEIVGKIND